MSMAEQRELYRDVAEKNKKISYESWLNSEGSRKKESFTDTISSGIALLKLSNPTYGALGGKLSERGLSKSGYADYIRNGGMRKLYDLSKSADHERYLNEYGDIKGYEKYVKDYGERQNSIMSDVSELIYKKRIFDIETAFAIAMDSGLSEENALTVSAMATKTAKQKTRDEALLFVNSEGMDAKQARDYAKSLGLDEKSITYILGAMNPPSITAKDFLNSLTAEQYLDYIESKYREKE